MKLLTLMVIRNYPKPYQHLFDQFLGIPTFLARRVLFGHLLVFAARLHSLIVVRCGRLRDITAAGGLRNWDAAGSSAASGRRSPVSGARRPADRVLLYTDGVIEARTPDGEFFTTERLADFLRRQDASGLPVPETLRRLRLAVLAHQRRQLQDDATILLVEWRKGSEQNMLPQII